MNASRRLNVIIHIQNIHKRYGYAMPVLFTEYLVGRNQGYYPPPLIPPTYKVSSNVGSKMQIFEDEFLRECARESARICFRKFNT
jgi:hypothetical protein